MGCWREWDAAEGCWGERGVGVGRGFWVLGSVGRSCGMYLVGDEGNRSELLERTVSGFGVLEGWPVAVGSDCGFLGG